MASDHPHSDQIETIRLWLNAFIPDTAETVTDVPGNGEHGGKKMLPAPGPLSRCYLTDQRGFSSDVDAPARMHSDIEVDVLRSRIIHQHHQCFETIEVDCETGEETCRKSADTDGMSFTDFEVSGDKHMITIKLQGSSKNPCLEVASLKVSPNVDYVGTVTIELDPSGHLATVAFDGRVEIYPAFEMYVRVNDEAPQALFLAHAMPGSTPMDLIGPPARDISRSIKVSI